MKLFFSFCLVLSMLSGKTLLAQSTLNDTLSIYPNPFATEATIRLTLGQPDTVSLEILNALGLVMFTGYQAQVLPADTFYLPFGGSFSNGIYVVRLKIGSSVVKTRRVIKTGLTDVSPRLSESLPNALVFPNPAKDWIYLPASGIKTLYITNASGQRSKMGSAGDQPFYIGDLPPGVYFLEWRGKEGLTGRQRMVKE